MKKITNVIDMKYAIKKNIIITFIIFAAAILSAAVLSFCGTKSVFAESAPVAEQTSTCDGTHNAPYTALTSDGGAIGEANVKSYYYLTQNTKLTNNISIVDYADVTICLNGYILCGNGSDSVIAVSGTEAKLTVCDCKEKSAEARHRHYYTENSGLWKFTDEGGEFLTAGDENKTVVGGVITGGYEDYGGGINVNGYRSVLEFTGGTVSGNSTRLTGDHSMERGGGIFVGGTLLMKGGAVCGNTATDGGGIYVYGSLTLDGGVIKNNSAENGGGIYSSQDSTINGGTVSNNSASGNGGGLYISESTGSLNTFGGDITDNSASMDGGGVYSDGSIIVNGGMISNNSASGNGGGICCNNESILISGTISGNSAVAFGGGIFAGRGAKLHVFGGEITDNSVANGGGVAAIGTFNMSGGEIAGNSASVNGGGIFVMIGSATVEGGTIRNNRCIHRSTSQLYSGGIAIDGGTLALHGNPVIADNHHEAGVETVLRNILLENDTKINIDGAFSGGAKIGVYAELNGASELAITSGYSTHNTETNAYAYFTTDNDLGLCVNADGEIAVSDTYRILLDLYKDGSGAYVVDNSLTSYRESGSAIVLPIPTRGGYTFGGWYENEALSGEAVTEIAAGSKGNKTFYAKWNAVTQNDLLGGENIKFGSGNLWDCQRMPRYPLGQSPFYIYGLNSPLDVTGKVITFNADDYVRFVPYAGDGEAVTDTDNDGVITVGELNASDRERIVGSLYGNSNATCEQAILDAVVVSEIKYDKDGNPTVLSNTGLIWALGEEGFLYTALDPDCFWSYTGGVGTFITFKSHNAGGGLNYVPHSSDPIGKDDFIPDGDGNGVLPVPTPETEQVGEESFGVFGIVVDENGNPLENARVTYNGLQNSHNTNTDKNGNFIFDKLSLADFSAAGNFGVEYGSYGIKNYNFEAPDSARYDIIKLVYPLSGAGSGETGDGSITNEITSNIGYMNMFDAAFTGKFPISYIEGVGVALVSPARTYYDFEGWYENGQFTGDPVTEISAARTGNIILYAKWKNNHAVHTWGEGVVTKNATCTEQGATTFTCSECGETKTEAITALGHDYGEWTMSKEPTCAEPGEEMRVCSRDETHFETRAVAIDETAHDWGEGVVTKKPTCIEPGVKTFTCSVCGGTKPEAVIALGHDYGEWTMSKEPTCAEPGEEKRVCSHDGSHIETREIAIDETAHDYGEWTETKKPTCAEKGEEKRVCAHDEKHIETREIAIDETAHNFGEWTETKKPTAEGDGEESRVCSICGKTEKRAVKYEVETESLLWLIILLAVLLAAETVILALRIRARKKSKSKNRLNSFAVLPLTAAIYPMGEIVAVAVLAGGIVAVGIAIACTFIKKKENAVDAASPDSCENEDLTAAQEEIEKTPEQTAGAEVEPEAEAKPEPEANDEEASALENEMASELENAELGDKSEGLSLKESLALASEHSQIKINKQSVSDWLAKNYGESVNQHRRANKTKTGLPLADTHYVATGAKRKCFIYVYELDGDKSMLLLKTDDETAKEIADKYPLFVKSRFPKTRRDRWYTLVPDGDPDGVFDVIALVISKYTENLRAAKDEVRKEIARIDEIKKSDVSAEEAKALVSDEAAAVLVTGRRHRKTGKKFAVNIDTLSSRYDADDTVDLESLKAKGIVPKSVMQIKILARGILDKPLTVVADDFSADAVKMIVLTGGEALWA